MRSHEGLSKGYELGIYLVAVWRRCYSSEFWKVIDLSPAWYGSLSLLVDTFKRSLEVAIVIVFNSHVLSTPKLCALTLPLKITMCGTEVFRTVVSWFMFTKVALSVIIIKGANRESGHKI